MIPILLALGLSCGRPPTCEDGPATVLATDDGTALTCRQAGWLVEYWTVLRGSPVPAAEARLVRAEVRSRFGKDPVGTLALLERVRSEGATLLALPGSDAAQRRSESVYAALNGKGLIGPDEGELARLQSKLLPVWGSSDEAAVSLTEADVEAWIGYASLCREVQGGTPLRISVADRVRVYRSIQARFKEASAPDQIAMAAIGPIWTKVKRAWPHATYDEQQAWIAAAPLPGPMTATSPEYAEAIVKADVAGHVAALRTHFGAFTGLADGPMFLTEDPEDR